MWQIMEVYVIEASSGLSLASDGVVVIAQFDLAFEENCSKVAVA